jgi:hypothetical protein
MPAVVRERQNTKLQVLYKQGGISARAARGHLGARPQRRVVELLVGGAEVGEDWARARVTYG